MLFDRGSLEDIRSEYIRICKEITFGSACHNYNCSFLKYGIKGYQSVSDFDSMVTFLFKADDFSASEGILGK